MLWINWPKISHPCCIRFFGQQDDARHVEPVKSLGVHCEKAVYGSHNIVFDNSLACFKEGAREAIWTWRFVRRHDIYCILNLFVGCVKIREVMRGIA